MWQRQRRAAPAPFAFGRAAKLGFASVGLLAACSSEPLTNDGSGGEAGESGTAGAGSRVDLPDYSESPCFGDTALTDVYDGETHEVSAITATCRGEGERTKVFVADDMWSDVVTQDQVNGFLHRFELIGNSKSAHPDLGVLATNEAVFGALDTGSLSEGTLAIFVIDTRGGGDGYLCSWCDEAELHLDGRLVAPLDGEEALSIAAHESYHAIHRGFDANETLWLDETIAEAAMSVNGFFTDGPALSAYTANPNVDWGPAGADVTNFHYGAGLAFGTFLWERGGTELMRAITSEALDGFAGLDAALATAGRPESGWEMFVELGIALHFDDPARGFGFESFDLTPKARAEAVTVGEDFSGVVQPYGFVYYALSADMTSLSVSGSGDLAALLLRDGGAIEREDVPLGEETMLAGPPAVLMLTAPASTTYSLSTR
jgi:hypothetical protein